jgi:hypothetical protein
VLCGGKTSVLHRICGWGGDNSRSFASDPLSVHYPLTYALGVHIVRQVPSNLREAAPPEAFSKGTGRAPRVRGGAGFTTGDSSASVRRTGL